MNFGIKLDHLLVLLVYVRITIAGLLWHHHVRQHGVGIGHHRVIHIGVSPIEARGAAAPPKF